MKKLYDQYNIQQPPQGVQTGQVTCLLAVKTLQVRPCSSQQCLLQASSGGAEAMEMVARSRR